MQKKMTKNRIIFLAVVATLIIAILTCIFVLGSSGRELKKQLDLGHKCLLEQDYEQAIASFRRAIEIDPMNEDAYLGMADAYIGKGDLEKAKAILESAINLFEEKGFDANLFKLRLDEIQEKLEVTTDRATDTAQEELISPSSELVTVDDYDESLKYMYEALRDERYTDARALLNEYGYNTVNSCYTPNDSEGDYGVKIIFTNNWSRYIYYGELVNMTASGEGYLFGEHWGGGELDYKMYRGVFTNDIPNGEFECISASSYYEGEYQNIDCIRGMLVDGLWDGQVFWLDESTGNWAEGPSFNMGQFVFDQYTYVNDLGTICFKFSTGPSWGLGSDEDILAGPWGRGYTGSL